MLDQQKLGISLPPTLAFKHHHATAIFKRTKAITLTGEWHQPMRKLRPITQTVFDLNLGARDAGLGSLPRH